MRLPARANRLFTAAAMAVSSAFAFAQLHDISFDERGSAALRAQVQPGSMLRWCGQMRPGEDIYWEFESADPLDMNVHYLDGASVIFPAAPDKAEQRSGRLVSTGSHLYCWAWSNAAAAPIALQAKLQKATRTR